MIAKAKLRKRKVTPKHWLKFLKMRPLIARAAHNAFKGRQIRTNSGTHSLIQNLVVCSRVSPELPLGAVEAGRRGPLPGQGGRPEPRPRLGSTRRRTVRCPP
jgi:hypothetical protein